MTYWFVTTQPERVSAGLLLLYLFYCCAVILPVMFGQPLQAFSPPTALLSFLSGGSSSGLLVTWVLYAVFIFWGLYTIITIYHWLRYSHASWVALPAIGVHLFVSFVLMSYALSGAFFL